MTAWHRSRKADIALRLLGLVLCGVSYLAVSHLYDRAQAHPGADADVLSLAWAAVGFIAASTGGLLAFLGNHLFDQVERPARCRRSSNLSETDEGL